VGGKKDQGWGERWEPLRDVLIESVTNSRGRRDRFFRHETSAKKLKGDLCQIQCKDSEGGDAAKSVIKLLRTVEGGVRERELRESMQKGGLDRESLVMKKKTRLFKPGENDGGLRCLKTGGKGGMQMTFTPSKRRQKNGSTIMILKPNRASKVAYVRRKGG